MSSESGFRRVLLAARIGQGLVAVYFPAGLGYAVWANLRGLHDPRGRFPRSELLPWVAEAAGPPSTEQIHSAVVSARTPVMSGFVKAPECVAAGTTHTAERVTPLSAETVGIQVGVARRAFEQLRYGQALAGYEPSELSRALEEAFDAWVEKLEKRRFAACRGARRAPRRSSSNPRHIPAAVKHAVWQRDGGRCTFVGEGGQRCPATTHLEYDHVVPVARGGGSDEKNLRLRCRAHNQFEAERTFGTAFMNGKREAAKHASKSRPRAEAERRPAGIASAPAGRPGMPPNANTELMEDAVAGLQSLGYSARQAREAVARCELPPGATFEQWVRAALRWRVEPLLVRSERIAGLAT